MLFTLAHVRLRIEVQLLILRRKLKMRIACFETKSQPGSCDTKGRPVGPWWLRLMSQVHLDTLIMQQASTLCTTWSNGVKGIPTIRRCFRIKHLMHGLNSKLPGDFILYLKFLDEMEVRDSICCIVDYAVLSPHSLSKHHKIYIPTQLPTQRHWSIDALH